MRRQRDCGPKAIWLKGLSLEMVQVRKADVVVTAESNTVAIVKVRMSQLPRGQRPWHVRHSYDTATRETLFVLRKEYGRQALQSKGSQIANRESDHCVVPMMPGNAGRGKAVTYYQSRKGNISYTRR